VVSQNASDTESAKFLVHIIKTIGMPVTTQVGPLNPERTLFEKSLRH